MSDELLQAYETLDLPPGAALDDVKAAYRDLAKVWHPDRYQHEPMRLQQRAERMLKQITAAYQLILSAGAASPNAAPIPMDFGRLWGYIDESGATVIHPQFEEARAFDEGLAAARTVGKWGFIDHAGEFVITPLYDEAGDFHEGLAAVLWRGKWGYIDRTGAFAIIPRFQAAEPFQNGVARVRLGARAGEVDREGRVVFDATSGRHLED
ncbi:MAG: J domain-containing protein [Bryobacteraceae bacterium]|nr:J domain-containing protein [Bryobacteraceae bacterium]